MSRVLLADPRARRVRSAMLENRIWNPGGGSGATNWTTNGTVGTVGPGPALDQFPASVRFTRSTTGSWRLAGTASLVISTLYTLRMRVRASEALTSVQVTLRPNVTASTGQVVLGTLTIPAGESDVVLSGTTTTTAPVASAGVALIVPSGSIGTTVDVVASLTKGATDPGVIFSGDWDWARWTGAVFASPSLGYPGLVRP